MVKIGSEMQPIAFHHYCKCVKYAFLVRVPMKPLCIHMNIAVFGAMVQMVVVNARKMTGP